jgi:hypothetical protein
VGVGLLHVIHNLVCHTLQNHAPIKHTSGKKRSAQVTAGRWYCFRIDITVPTIVTGGSARCHQPVAGVGAIRGVRWRHTPQEGPQVQRGARPHPPGRPAGTRSPQPPGAHCRRPVGWFGVGGHWNGQSGSRMLRRLVAVHFCAALRKKVDQELFKS